MTLRKISLGLLVSAVCLFFVLRNVDWSQVWAHLRDINPALFGVSMLLMLVAYFLMTWRWRHLLDPLEIPSLETGSLDEPKSEGVRDRASLPRLYGMTMV